MILSSIAVAQEGTPGTLSSLKPLLPQLQQAIEAEDIDRAHELLNELSRAVAKERAARYSPSALLEKLEKAIQSRPEARPTGIAGLAFYAAKAGQFDKARSYAIEALSYASIIVEAHQYAANPWVDGCYGRVYFVRVWPGTRQSADVC